MASTRKTIKSDVWRLIFIPSIALIVLLASSLTYLCLTQVNKFFDYRGSLLAEKTGDLMHIALLNKQPQLAQTLLDTAIEEAYVRAIHVYYQPTDTHLHSGPHFLADESSLNTAWQRPYDHKTFRSLRFHRPFNDPTTQQPVGWVEVEIWSAPYAVVQYEAVLLAIGITLCCLILGIYFAITLYSRISLPIEHIKNVVHALARGRLDERVKPQYSSEFLGLAESINTMADYMGSAQADLQSHVDHAIEDLRETLETIEIQNVELDLARKDALEASRVKSEFLANTSHEIRTPLNGILGFINLALKTELTNQQREYIETIRDSAQNLLTVINGILDFSKIESGKLTLDYTTLPIRQTVDEVIHLLAPSAQDKNIELISHADHTLPNYLLGDPLRFKQILSNLINNAIKYSEKGNIVIDVSALDICETQVTLKVCVSDEGIGLSREDQLRIFSPFNQADSSTSRSHEGTGLGLAICKGLVERMNGEIGVVSAPNEGATFWFTGRFGIDKRANQATPADLSEYRILICAENDAISKQLDNVLGEWFGRTACIHSIHECFSALRLAQQDEQAFDVLILDVSPTERTYSSRLLQNLAEQLKDEFNCLFIACCTPAHQRLLDDGAEKDNLLFVNKPITHDILLKTLGRELDLHVKEFHENKQELESISALIVDDNPANLQLASELLSGLKTTVAQASSGLEAIEQFKHQPFDIIFMDIQMPGMDGLETTKHIRQLEKPGSRTPIIALTAHTITDQKADLLIAGMDDCISKPISESQLAHLINRWASLSGKREVVARQDAPPTPATPSLEDGNGSVDVALSLKLANHKPGLAKDMLTMLLDSLPSDADAIASAIRDGNFDVAGQLVHRLYGSSCYCGVPRLKHICGLVDKMLQADQHEQAQAALPALMHAIDDLMTWSKNKNLDEVFKLDH